MAASTPVDTQQQRLIERLREADGQAVTFAELHAAGIDFPAAVVTELELAGYGVERVVQGGRPAGVRLREPDRIRLPGAPARRRWPWNRKPPAD